MSFEPLIKKCRENSIWEWTIDDIRKKLDMVCAGRSLQPDTWPNNAKIAALFSVDVDNETAPLVEDEVTFIVEGSQYSARKGLRRIVKVFDEYNVPATFFTPAISLQLSPEISDLLQKSGLHEIAAHGWIHEPLSALSPDQRYELLAKSRDCLEEFTGYKPVGFRSPYGDITDDMISILKELGFSYDSSLTADESPYEVNIEGMPSGMIELPASFDLEDSPLYLYNGVTSGIMSPRDILQVYKDAFDTIYEEGSMMVLIMHPHITSRPSRIIVLKEIIEYMRERGDVWFATHRQTADYVKEQFKIGD